MNVNFDPQDAKDMAVEIEIENEQINMCHKCESPIQVAYDTGNIRVCSNCV